MMRCRVWLFLLGGFMWSTLGALAVGMGVMVLDRQSAASPLANPELVEIDLGFSLPPSEFYLICAKSMRYVPRVRAVTDLLIERLHGAGAS